MLGFGPDDEANLIATFREIAEMDLCDGIVFDLDSVKADAIREDNTYGGTRITLVARIGSARCALRCADVHGRFHLKYFSSSRVGLIRGPSTNSPPNIVATLL